MCEEVEIVIEPIATVYNNRKEMIDDNWGSVISTIEINSAKFEKDVLLGLSEFSHLEVVFYMHKVATEKIAEKARHPRGNMSFPLVGIFAQRVKNRPNRIGVSRCKLLKVESHQITVQGLDAINCTPVLDIKPYIKEFGPIGQVKQPFWATEIMSHYYDL